MLTTYVLLYRTLHTYEDSKLVQEDLNTLIKWSKTWQMSFNLGKYIHLKISNKPSPIYTNTLLTNIERWFHCICLYAYTYQIYLSDTFW